MVGKNKLSRSASLKRKAEIDLLFEQGQRFPTDFFTLLWQPAEQFQYGLFVSRRHGSAVERNRVKRLYREAIRLSRERLELPGRIGILPRTGRKPDLERLINDVGRIFQRISNAD